jgi:hypothetical protein
MIKTICKISTCLNFGKYCRRPGHTAEKIEPMRTVPKTGDKLKQDLKAYRREARLFITLNPKCKVCGAKATEIHHKQGRIGELLLDKTKWLAVCSDCHQRITEDSDWAIKNGYSISRLANNT